MTKLELMNTLRVVKRAFPNHVLDVEAYELWYTLFENETAEHFMTAILSCVKEPGRQFFPTPGEVNKYLQHSKGESSMTAGEAWNLAYSSCCGSERAFLDKYENHPALIIATRQIGLRNIALADIQNELPFLRKEFIRTFEQNIHKEEMGNNFALTHSQAKKMLDTINVGLSDKIKRIK